MFARFSFAFFVASHKTESVKFFECYNVKLSRFLEVNPF